MTKKERVSNNNVYNETKKWSANEILSNKSHLKTVLTLPLALSAQKISDDYIKSRRCIKLRITKQIKSRVQGTILPTYRQLAHKPKRKEKYLFKLNGSDQRRGQTRFPLYGNWKRVARVWVSTAHMTLMVQRESICEKRRTQTEYVYRLSDLVD